MGSGDEASEGPAQELPASLGQHLGLYSGLLSRATLANGPSTGSEWLSVLLVKRPESSVILCITSPPSCVALSDGEHMQGNEQRTALILFFSLKTWWWTSLIGQLIYLCFSPKAQ